MTTNITDKHREIFEALTSGEYTNFALFSCFVDGHPTAAIVAEEPDPATGESQITPLFVAVNHAMELTDHDGNKPG